MMAAGPIRVAVVGGGIGGCTMANGLLKHPHIEFDVFEGNSAFKEQGAAVGLAANALDALRLIGPNLIDGLRAAGAVPANGYRLYMGEGPDKDAVVFHLESPKEQESLTVHRALFLKELLKPVLEGSLHVNKKLGRIEQDGTDMLTLHFEDGTSGQYHAVIGSDGIRSTVRKTVLVDHPDFVDPFFAGFWDVRAVLSTEAAQRAKIMDAVSPEERAWMGNGGYIIHQLMNDGKLLGCIVAGIANESYDGTKWRNPVTRAELEQALGDRGEFGKTIVSIMLEDPEPFAFSEYESAKAPTYCNRNVCMMGDAAHAMTPWQGSGAGTSIEDAAVLEALLGKVTSPSQIPAAFKAYDEVRRPRTQRIVETSREVAVASCGKDPTMGLDLKKLAERLPRKWDHIRDIDMDQHVADALVAFERFQGEGKVR